MAEKRSSWGLFLSFIPLEPFVPQGVACPQLCLNLGSDDVSRTPFLLQLKSWEAECSGSLSPGFLPHTPGSGCLRSRSTHPHGSEDQGPPKEEERWGPRFGVQGLHLGHFGCHLFGTATLREGG